MSTIEKVYSEERAHKSATAIPSSKTPLSPKLKAIARRMFSGPASPAAGRPEQQCWDDAIVYERRLQIGDPLTPVYNEYVEEINGERNVRTKINAARFKAMTKAEIMLHLRDDGITHTMTAMRKMTKAKLETIAFMRSVVIPEDGEG